jgi:hypothetical protein
MDFAEIAKLDRSSTHARSLEAIARRRADAYGEPLRAALATALRNIYQTAHVKGTGPPEAARQIHTGGVRSAMSSGYDAPIDPMKLARITQ